MDEIIVFHALTEEHLKKIVEIQLGPAAGAAGGAAHHAGADGRGEDAPGARSATTRPTARGR